MMRIFEAPFTPMFLTARNQYSGWSSPFIGRKKVRMVILFQKWTQHPRKAWLKK
jgi:hypothetical protein